jgi:flagellar motor switch protein FliN/FliY
MSDEIESPDDDAAETVTPGAETAAEPAATQAAAAPEPATAPTQRTSRPGMFLGVPIEVTISVGKARPLVSELVELRRDSVLPLDSTIDDPVELYIGDRLIARGELQEIGDDTGRLGVRLTEVADFSNDM